MNNSYRVDGLALYTYMYIHVELQWCHMKKHSSGQASFGQSQREVFKHFLRNVTSAQFTLCRNLPAVPPGKCHDATQTISAPETPLNSRPTRKFNA